MFHRIIPVGLAACLAIFASGCAGRVPEVSKPLAVGAPEPQGKPPEPGKECPPLPAAPANANRRADARHARHDTATHPLRDRTEQAYRRTGRRL